MNRPQITIPEAIRIAVSYSKLESSEPYCVSAIYDSNYIELVIYTLFQRYDFYVDSRSGEVSGIMSEPIEPDVNEEAKICA